MVQGKTVRETLRPATEPARTANPPRVDHFRDTLVSPGLTIPKGEGLRPGHPPRGDFV